MSASHPHASTPFEGRPATDTRSNAGSSTPPTTRETFEKIADVVDWWAIETSDDPTARELAYDFRRFLHRRIDSRLEIELGRTRRECDLTIERRIGIKFITFLSDGSREWLHKELRSLTAHYDYLLVFGHNVDPKHTDVWRSLKRSVSRTTSLRSRVQFSECFDVDVFGVDASNTARPAVRTGLKLLASAGFLAILSVVLELYVEVGHADQLGQAFLTTVALVNVAALSVLVFLWRFL